MPWVHIDLSAGRHKGGLAHIPSEITGFGVRLTVELLRGGSPSAARRAAIELSANDQTVAAPDAASASGIASRFRGFLPVIIDVETGGFNSATDALLEIAAVLVRLDAGGDLELAERHRYLVKPFPGSRLDPASLQVTGIDPFHPLRPAIDEAEALQRVFQEVRKELKAQNCTRAILVGHNSSSISVPERGRRAHGREAQSVPSVLDLRHRHARRRRLRTNRAWPRGDRGRFRVG